MLLLLLAIAGIALALGVIPRLRRGASTPTEPPDGALYHELLRSPLPTDLFYELEILVHPSALEFGWRSPALDRGRALGITRRLIGGGRMLWVTLPPAEIIELGPRRFSTPQAFVEIISPSAGLGLTGEVKFRIRGVRTGFHIRTTEGKRYCLATRHPNKLIAAIETLRYAEDGPHPRDRRGSNRR